MHKLKSIGEGFLTAGIVFLLFLVTFAHLIQVPGWLKVSGRMHPMFLHFPIVLLLLSLLSLWIPAKEPGLLRWLRAFRFLAAITALITAIMGLLLSLEEDRSGSALQWHKWTGVSVALLAAAFYYFHAFLQRHLLLGRAMTIITCAVVITTGHYGASLTHGANYLLAPLTIDRKVPVNQAVVFNDVIKPILEAKCTSCHGDDNLKGGLALNDISGIKNGGKTGPVLVSGDPSLSLLMHRIYLPSNDKKHMPPKAKAQLTDEETELLHAWIRSGAILDKKLTTLPVQDSFRILASNWLGAGEGNDQPVYTFKAADGKTIASLNNNYRVLEQAGENSPAIAVHFYGKEAYSSKAVEELLQIKQQIIDISLARMPVKDADLAFIRQMPNLRRLNLNYTDITGKGLDQLTGMKNLQELALSGTAVDKASVAKLVKLPQLESIYVWNTSIDSAQAAAISKQNKNLHLEVGFFDNGLVMTPLSPPVIKTPSGISNEPVLIELKHPFTGVDIRYTLDGSPPDSVNSALYKSPFQVDSSVKLIARAFKKGWIGSNDARATYLRRKFTPDSIELLTNPDQKFIAGGSKILNDGLLGKEDFNSGGWLGFRQNDASILIYFKEPKNIHSVLVSTLQSTGSYIFPPAKIEVWGGTNKNQLKPMGKINPVLPEKNTGAKTIQQTIQIKSEPVSVIKLQLQRVAKLPAWHEGKGQPAWVFVSEVIVN